MLSVALLFVPFSASFTLRQLLPLVSYSSPHGTGTSVAHVFDGDGNDNSDNYNNHKRFIIASTLAIIPFLGWNYQTPTIIMPPTANAVQEKNEVLCNTGFFTNVGAWYCTDIGNIGDEGKSKPMSGEAESSVDSLMSKFDLDGGDVISNDKAGGSNNQVDELGEKQNAEKGKKNSKEGMAVKGG